MDIITKVQELIEELNGKMILLNLKKKNKMEIKIQIPDNCELVKDENTYIVKEKKLSPPRSWDEFCEKFPVQIGEAFIESSSLIHTSDGRVIIMTGNFWNSLALSFPTGKMAVDFFECFRGLCETAKTLL